MAEKMEVYRDERYVLGRQDDAIFLIANGEKYTLTCHPYEPCLYITDEKGNLTAVHNAFDPSSVLRAFSKGESITSITGMEYSALDFCKMVEYAQGLYNIQIDEAEQVFGGRAKSKSQKPETKKEERHFDTKIDSQDKVGKIIEDEKVSAILSDYPDSVIDFCLVKNEHLSKGYNSHWFALDLACRKMFVDENDEVIWHYDTGKADAKEISASELFAKAEKDEKLNYRKAFLYPPYTCNYTDADFDKINSVLFPKGMDNLEIYQWTTNWSEYFDEGNEWWGSLCITVLDKSLDRFVVILASATD